MDAVYQLLQETSARDLTMEQVARRAGVGKPTLYKWWPTKAALIMAMFHERLAATPEVPNAKTAEGAIRAKMQRLVAELNGLFGKVMAELIAEGQSEPDVLRDLYDRHISGRRASTVADIERGKASGEIRPDVDSNLLVDVIFGPVYYRLLLKLGPLTEEYGDDLVTQAFRGIETTQ